MVIKSILHSWWRLTRGLTLGVRGVVVDGDRVLLVRHSYVAGWHLPGGGVERGETLVEALKRELVEEAGISIRRPPRLHAVYCNEDVMPGDHVAVFIVDHWHRDEQWRPTLEIRAADWFPLAALPQDAAPGTRRRLVEIFGKEPPGDRW